MSKTYEENTKDFYNELNGECDPEKLLYIAKQGIFLKEPLFKYKKIKNHEFVVDISVINEKFLKEVIVNRGIIPDMTFYIFKYFYSNTHKYLLENLIKIKEKNIGDILMKIIIEFGNDINILNYCLDKIKQYNIKIESIGGYRYYSDRFCIKNHLYLKCEDKNAEEFINTCFTDEFLNDFHTLNKKYEVIDINKNNTNEKETNKKETNKKEYIYDIPSQLINIIDPQDINFDFIKKYLKNYKRIDRILKDPNYILNLDVVINNYTDYRHRKMKRHEGMKI
ncbi:hypothetical protein H8356DRAFT_1351908 [Neocallimastix lanati (nom. inval.)]|nr:hypothetical protein H8356DRAFT_1351908 [Neocallimastix sp. JGI-2020a]